MVSWTELFGSFVPIGAGWQDYDILTNQGVPRGAVAHIVACNGNDAADRTLGVRTDGSALNRYVLVHEAEAGGNTTAEFWVKVDSATGLIETYCDNTLGVTFYVTGYLTDTDFTELFSDISATNNATWDNRDIFTSDGVPTGRACSVMCGVVTEATQNVGVRTDGSALNRYINVHEAEGGAGSGNFFTVSVKCAATGIIEVYAATAANAKHYLLGYFGIEIDYTEKGIVRNNLGAAGWTGWDLTTELDQDGRLCDIYCGHFSTGAEVNAGARFRNSVLNRYILEHEAEASGNTGFVMPTHTDRATGILELYTGDATTDYMLILGYYKYTEVVKYPIWKLKDKAGDAKSRIGFSKSLKLKTT